MLIYMVSNYRSRIQNDYLHLRNSLRNNSDNKKTT